MDNNSEISSLIYSRKEDFEKKFKESLVTDSLRQIISKGMPADKDEKKRLDDPAFREKFNKILSPVSKEMLDKFDNVGQFDTGNLFSSMVNSISDSVSLESDYRMQKIFNDIKFNRVPSDIESLRQTVESRFENLCFESKEIGLRAVENFKLILSTEDASDVLDEIKDEVKTAIDETEDKNKLVEGTTKEILDYKKEMAPPDMSYEDPTKEESGDDSNDDNAEGEQDDVEESNDENQDTNTPDTPEDETDATSEGNTEEGETGDKNDSNEDDNSEDESNSDQTTEPDDTSADDTSVDDNTVDDTGAISTPDPSTQDDSDTTDVDVNSELNADGANADPASAATDTSPSNPPAGTTQVQAPQSGIVINISGADLKTAKESLNIMTAESFAEKIIPTHHRSFDIMALPKIEELASEACCGGVFGDAAEAVDYRFTSLKYAIGQLRDDKSVEALTTKFNEFKDLTTEALKLSNTFKDTMYKIGLTFDGIANSTESAFYSAANIIKRFVTETQKVNRSILPYTSKENILANAFDILQLRKECRYAKEVDPAVAEDLMTRESAMFKNFPKIEDKELQNEVDAIMDLVDVNFKKALTPNFITDYSIKSWEVNVGEKSNKEINETVKSRVNAKFKDLWGRDLNKDEMEIVEAVCSNEDPTLIAPNPMEKFLVKLSKESMFATDVVKMRLSKAEKKDIKFKAKLFTSMYKSLEAFNMIDTSDVMAFESFCDNYLN